MEQAYVSEGTSIDKVRDAVVVVSLLLLLVLWSMNISQECVISSTRQTQRSIPRCCCFPLPSVPSLYMHCPRYVRVRMRDYHLL
jgi:hypothetical protein